MAEQGFFEFDGVPPPDYADIEAGKIAAQIFRPWVMKYYAGNYTQSRGHIMKVLKQFVKEIVVEQKVDQEVVRIVMDEIGINARPITTMTLQLGMSRALREMERRNRAGANRDMASRRDFQQQLNQHQQDEENNDQPF